MKTRYYTIILLLIVKMVCATDYVSPDILSQAYSANGEAAAIIADLYFYGKGVKQDKNKAFFWYKKSADAKFAIGMTQYAMMLLENASKLDDISKVVEIFEAACSMKAYKACHNLGGMFATGNGVEKDLDKALKYGKIAADSGDVSSQMMVASLLIKRNKDGDRVAAIEMLERASNTGNADAKEMLGRVCFESNDSELYEKCGELLRSAYKLGNVNAGYNLAIMIREKSIKANKGESYASIMRSVADSGNWRAQLDFGVALMHGDGVNKDEIKANYYFTLAALQNSADAYYYLGYGYKMGKGVQKSLQKSKLMLEKAAELGKKDALDLLNY